MTSMWVAAAGSASAVAAAGLGGGGAGRPVTAAPGLVWGMPFAGLLLTIALCPMLAPRFWHQRMGAVAAGWALALLLPLAVLRGPGGGLARRLARRAGGIPAVRHPAAGAVHRRRRHPAGRRPLGHARRQHRRCWRSAPRWPGVMGTTGVAMVLIHPLLRANAHRARKVHLVVFFIVLVANAGGATTPLGDPPLYLGFLHGVPFGWPLRNLTVPLLVVALPLLAGFWLLDRRLARGEPPPPPPRPLRVRGRRNVGAGAAGGGHRAAAGRLAPRRGGAARPADRRWSGWSASASFAAITAGLAADHPARRCASATCSAGSRCARWRCCSPPSSSPSARCWRCWPPGMTGRWRRCWR